jgi:hypothetical protein
MMVEKQKKVVEQERNSESEVRYGIEQVKSHNLPPL